MGLYKKTAILCSVLLCFSISPNTSVKAIEPEPVLSEEDSDNWDTENLIFNHDQSLTSSSGKLYLDTYTHSLQTMAEIGVIDLEVQYSMNGSSGWTPLLFPNDQINTNTTTHKLEDFEISVFHNRYYRVVLTHYALEPGLIFPDSQSIYETTNPVWVS